MTISVDAIAHRVRKRLGLEPSIRVAADEVLELHPGDVGETPPPFSLPRQIERAREAVHLSTLKFELERAITRRIQHAPTYAFRFRRATMIDGVVYANGARQQQVAERERWRPRWLDAPEIDRAALASSVIGDQFFGHVIADDSCAAYLGRELAPVCFTEGRRPRSAHAMRYLELYGLADVPRLRTAHLREAWLFQDFGMNGHKRARFRQLRERLRVIPPARSGHGVFFRRRGAGLPRGLMNEAAIEERLAREGYEIIDVARADADEIIRRTRDASVVCGVEGSALMHGLLCMREGGALVSLQPPYRFTMALRDHADAMGMRYGFVVGIGTRTRFEIDEDEVLSTLELAWGNVSDAGQRRDRAA
ncbi:glycosyltransferase 61 family protein [Sandaracinus amylolyticus]|uniref:glycosyltransferase 61 family protein n=1 Tax=Sandaracinus amylolyticus TaxID=927083 RepID=UPI001F4216CA|nr:glycosyltransferase family 61 protein [Sandaracinus amylolyticus]